tara:strand:- start:36007 stop:36675 length:669 start_codon:yes stop_codon:yes gene_type:complete
MYLAAELLDRIAVAQFVKCFHHGIDQPQDRQISRVQNAVAYVRCQRAQVHCRKHTCRQYQDKPDQREGPGQQGAHHRQRFRQETVRVPYRKPHSQRRPYLLLDLHAVMSLVAAKQFAAVGRHIGDKRIRCMQLSQQADGLILGGRAFAKLFVRNIPDFAQRTFSVQHPDQAICRGRKPMRPTRGQILKDEPDPTPVVVTIDVHMSAQSWLQVLDPVPRWRKE